MPVFLLTLIAKTGIPARFAKLAAWALAVLVAVALCCLAVVWLENRVQAGKDDAVALDRADITVEASNRVIAATSAATANQMASDDAFAEDQKELRHEADTKSNTNSVGPGVQSVLDGMRKQQEAGRRR